LSSKSYASRVAPLFLITVSGLPVDLFHPYKQTSLSSMVFMSANLQIHTICIFLVYLLGLIVSKLK